MKKMFVLFFLLTTLGGARWATAQSGPNTIECRVYDALRAEPDLDDFPILFTRTRSGQIILLQPGLDPDAPRLSGLGARMAEARVQARKSMRATELIRDAVPLITFQYKTDPELSIEDVAQRRDERYGDRCTVRARLEVVSRPPGARVFVNGAPRGETPTLIELVHGDYELVLESEASATHREWIHVREGEQRSLDVELHPRSKVEFTSEPSGALVLLHGEVVGHTPIDRYIDAGDTPLRLVARGHEDYEATISLSPGEIFEAHLTMTPANEDRCHPPTADGPASKAVKTLAKTLPGTRLLARVPLYQVLTSEMERRLPATHVIDGERLAFEPKMGKSFVSSPFALLGRELGGLSFGEIAAEVVASPVGFVTITEVARKKNTVVLSLLDENGERNGLYLDFTAGLERTSVEALFEALCLVLERAESLAPTADRTPGRGRARLPAAAAPPPAPLEEYRR